MDRQPVSIAMATYNGASYLKEQLDSLAQQKMPPLELIVCDDRSTDATLDVLSDFEKTAPFAVQIFSNERRLGYKQNFMKAASLCGGDIVAFCDQDDIWNENKITVVTNAFRDAKCLVVSHDFSVMFNDGRQSIPSYFDQLERSGFSRAVGIKGCTMAFQKALLDRLGWPGPQSGWAHDAWIALIGTALNRRGYIYQPLIRHRIHGNNTSGWLARPRKFTQFVRKIRIPPFTSSEDVDELIELCFDVDSIDEFIDAISNSAFELSAARRAHVIASLRKKLKMKSFREGEAYEHVLQRVIGAVRLFFGLNYAVGDGLPGFIADIGGLRAARGGVSVRR